MKTYALIFFALLLSLWCWGAEKGVPLLPASFNGWEKNPGSVKTSTDPTIADAANADVLKEYRFTDGELATYIRDDRKMQVKAARFQDASGAFGAFTFYQQPQMQTAKIGDEGASNNLRVLFYRGNILVDVLLDQVTVMSAADLRVLANDLSPARGDAATPPTLPGNLPRKSFASHTERYVMGPVAMERLGGPVPPSLVDFSQSPEVVMAKYHSTWGEANLTLIEYPTPQIAAEKMRAMQAASLPGGPFYFKRSAPIVAIVNGNVPEDEAQTLLGLVNYDADVTITQGTKLDLKNNVGNLIVGIFVMIGLIALTALIFGFAFGGVRVLTKKLFPNRFFDRPDDVDIIRLNLK